jgi:hypothetical protein
MAVESGRSHQLYVNRIDEVVLHKRCFSLKILDVLSSKREEQGILATGDQQMKTNRRKGAREQMLRINPKNKFIVFMIIYII